MNSLHSKLCILAFILSISGCSSTLKPTTLNESGYFETSTKISTEGIKVAEAFKPEYKGMIYVKTDEKDETLNSFYLETFKNMKVFDQVMNKADMENLVIEKKLTDKISSVSDKIGLHSLGKEIGAFLVVEPYVEWKGGYDFIANLKAYDSENGKDVLVLENKAFNWAGLDKPLFYPLFNAFLEWVRGDRITTKAESTSK